MTDNANQQNSKNKKEVQEKQREREKEKNWKKDSLSLAHTCWNQIGLTFNDNIDLAG